MNEQAENLDILACAIDKRPAGAPSFFDVAGAMRGLRREGSTLTVEYDGSAAEAVEALAAAEAQCCPTIGWRVEHGPSVRLHILATPAQLDVLEQLLSGAVAES